MRLIFITLYAISVSLAPAWAQSTRRALTAADYDGWKSVQKPVLSNDGHWVAYEINPQEGDGQLIAEAPTLSGRITIPRGYGASFSADAAYLVVKVKPGREAVRTAKKNKLKPDKMPKDSLIVVRLLDGEKRSFANVVSFQIGEESGTWLAFMTKKEEAKKDTTQKTALAKKAKKPKGDLLTLLNMAGKEALSIDHVGEYAMSAQGNRILYTREQLRDTTIIRQVYAYTVRNQETEVLDSSAVVEVYKNLTLDKKGDQAAWMSSRDSAKADVKKFALFLRNTGSQNFRTTVAGCTSEWPRLPHLL